MTDAVHENRIDRAPMALLPYQQRWSEDEANVKVIEKSRRIGLSWGEAAEDALLTASQSGMDVWYIGYNKDMAQEFIEDAADWAKFYNKAATEVEEFVFKDENKDILSFRIYFASGYKITALSSRPSNLRGKQGKVVIDEAAFHDNLKELIKAAMALLMWGGKVVIISTHDGDQNPFNELIKEIRAGKKPYSLHRVTLDEALAQGLYRRICLRLGQQWSEEKQEDWRRELIDAYGDGADEELFCIPSEGSGTYLPRTLVETCTSADIQVIRYEQETSFAELADYLRYAEVQDWCDEMLLPLLKDIRDVKHGSYFGEDFARSGDLTVIWPFVELQSAVFKCPFLVELRNMPFRQQEQILFYIVDRLPRFQYGALDARGNGQYLAEVAMQKYGANRIAQVMLSEAWYRENMPPYKSAFEDRSIIIPKDADVIADHRAFKMTRGVAKIPETKEKGTDSKQRHGDAGVAGALAFFATRQEVTDTEIISGEPRETTTMFDGF